MDISGNEMFRLPVLVFQSTSLPPECQGNKYPVVIITQRNTTNPAYLNVKDLVDLPVDDLLVDCCQYGDIICLVPVSDPAIVSLLSESGVSIDSNYVLAVAATFSDDTSATTCAESLRNRPLRNNMALTTYIISPESDCRQAPSVVDHSNKEPTAPLEPSQEADDVDDFLNSLL